MAPGALLDFDGWLAAAAFSVSVGGLVPIIIIKENRRRELTLAVVVSLLIALTAVMAVRNHEHARGVRETQNEIVKTLSGNRWTLDQLYKQLNFPQRDVFFEALSGGVEEHRIRQGVVQVRIDESPPVDVRLYWVEPAGPQAAETRWPQAWSSLEPGTHKTGHRADQPARRPGNGVPDLPARPVPVLPRRRISRPGAGEEITLTAQPHIAGRKVPSCKA